MTPWLRFCAIALAGCSVLRPEPALGGDAPNLINVTTTADGINYADGRCSLREAVRNASENTQGSAMAGECPSGSASRTDLIRLSSGATYALSIAGSGNDQGDLNLFQSVPIDLDLRLETDGVARATIEQTVAGHRVIDNQAASVEIDNLILRGGDTAGNGGAILNAGGKLSVSRSLLLDNQAGGGGAIHNSGRLDIFDSELRQNQANTQDGGAIFNAAGASLRLFSTVLSNNISSFHAGAIHHAGINLELLDGCELENNSADAGAGGAIRTLGQGELLIANALFSGNSASSFGGAVAIESSGPILVRDTSFTNQFASSGGAIYSSGSQLLIERSVFTGNSASGAGGAIRAVGLRLDDGRVEGNSSFSGAGGGIQITASGTIRGSVIRNNAASSNSGGGIHASVLHLQDSLVELNSASVNGGGLFVQERADLLSVRSRSNLASGNGAGLYLAPGASPASVIRRSLFDSNSSAGQGGGLWLGGAASLGNATITLNSANSGGGGLYVAAGASVTAINTSLVENPTGRDLHMFGSLGLQNSLLSSAGQPDCQLGGATPQISSLGNNLASDASCTGLTHPSDQINTDPLLLPLADNGGFTLTYAPAEASPAVDAGNNEACAASPVDGLDQRGHQRPFGMFCDIGAHELGAQPPLHIFGNGFEAP